jgi:sulfate permease, SulP family
LRRYSSFAPFRGDGCAKQPNHFEATHSGVPKAAASFPRNGSALRAWAKTLSIIEKSLTISRRTAIPDLFAGITSALSYIPQGMGYAVVAGVNPVYGLYTGVFAPVLGAFLAGSSLMVITVTNELAVPTAGILASRGERSIRTLFTLTLLIGLIQIVFACLKLGSLTRFISNCVMTGFISGVAILLVFGQLQKLTGYSGRRSGNVFVTTWDLLLHLNGIDLRTTVVGLLTIAAIFLFGRTRLKAIAFILALVIATAAVPLLHWKTVRLVGAIAKIPRGLPSLVVPDFRAIPVLFLDALSLAILGLSIASGVSQAYPEADGTIPDASRDFLAQGAANIAGGFLQGMPAGGSISRTATSVSAGAKTRWTNIFAGVVLATFLLTVGWIAEIIPMASLAGLLVYIGFSVMRLDRIALVWNTHAAERGAMVATFALTLLIPLHWAIFAGVALTLLLFLYSSSAEVRLVRIVPAANGGFEEQPAPHRLPSDDVTALHAYGNAFFAAVSTLEAALPAVEDATNAVVIFGLRGRSSITTSGVAMLERYARKLQAHGSKLMLVGVEPAVERALERTGISRVIGKENIYAVTPNLGGPLNQALVAANQWLKSKALG